MPGIEKMISMMNVPVMMSPEQRRAVAATRRDQELRSPMTRLHGNPFALAVRT